MPVTPDAPDIKTNDKAADESALEQVTEQAPTKDCSTHGRGRTIVVTIVVVAIALCACGVAYIAKKLSGPAIQPGQTTTVTINKGSSAMGIANTLDRAEVIGDEFDFMKYIMDAGNSKSLQPGTYTFTTGSDNQTVMQTLVSGPEVVGTMLTVPEGLTINQTAAHVEEVCGISAAAFITRAHCAKDYEDDYPFLVGAYDNSLEGYLFPKTYNVPEGATADTVIRLMLDQFAVESSSLDLAYPTSKGLDLAQVVTMASLIERETLYQEDRPHVAGVIYNRLDQNMPLGLDVTIYYALERNGGTALSNRDLRVDSPYNTYKNKGLPPGPIANPSLASLQAACSPDSTPDYFFILTSDYSHYYVTYDEFLAGAAAITEDSE